MLAGLKAGGQKNVAELVDGLVEKIVVGEIEANVSKTTELNHAVFVIEVGDLTNQVINGIVVAHRLRLRGMRGKRISNENYSIASGSHWSDFGKTNKKIPPHLSPPTTDTPPLMNTDRKGKDVLSEVE